MATKKAKLIKVGKHFVNPNDISRISKVNVEQAGGSTKTLYIVKFLSDPRPEFACWVNKEDIGILLEQFEIVEGE